MVCGERLTFPGPCLLERERRGGTPVSLVGPARREPTQRQQATVHYPAPYDASISFATLRFKKAGDRLAPPRRGFLGPLRLQRPLPPRRADHRPGPGDYELYLGTASTKRYWQHGKAALSEEEKDSGRYTRIDDFSRSTVTATI
ncbi:hypothetical protein ACFWNR_18435 [Streptomyces virginiae]|uniref:hypothetical protein n=1 Tax=Streptomyces virginiae TaxID=1961 RepID=UPI00364A30C6